MLLDRLLRWPRFPGAIQAPLVAIAVAVALLSILPPRRSEMNVGAALVWQIWWALLPFFILLTARLWCAVCPFSTLGNLAQRLRPSPPPLPSARVRRLGAWAGTAGIALLGFLFLLLSLESNGPRTALLLALFAIGAGATGLLWRGRVWCRHLCPLGLTAGLYSRLAWLRLEPRDGPAKIRLAEGQACPVLTSPLSSRKEQDCVLCGGCMKGAEGEGVALRFGPPPLVGQTLAPPEAVAVSLLMGLLLADALRMTPIYLRYMVWAVPRTAGDYEAAMVLGMIGIVAFLLLGQSTMALLSGQRGWSWSRFAQLSLALLPLALATQLALSAQHLMAIGDVLRNLGAELGLLDPGHMPPTDAYITVWPLKVLQGAMLVSGALAAHRLTRPAVEHRQPVLAAGGALVALALLAIFAAPMSVAC